MFKNIVSPTLLMLSVVSGGYAQQAPAPEVFGNANQPTYWLSSTRGGEVSALEQAWQKAKSDEQKEAVREKASAYLDRQFEADMKRRENELESIEARVEKLRNQLERRIEKKDDIIGLQLKQMTMSWEGLGWSEPVERNDFQMAWSVQPPMPPNATGQPSNLSVALGFDENSSEELLKEIAMAADDDDQDELRRLAATIAEQADRSHPGWANSLVWPIYERFGDEIDDKKFWLMLAKATKNAAYSADRLGLPAILDTSARCYYLGGDLETAIRVQEKAVRNSGGDPNSELAGFLKKLKKMANDEENGSSR